MKLKSIIQLFLIVIFFLIGVFYTSEQVNASTYGGCSYGGGSYNHQCPTSTPAPSSDSGSSNSGSSGGGSNTCTKQAPASPPDLFQIDTTAGTTAKLFFAPSQQPHTGYYVSYGDGKNTEGYGAEFSLSQSNGALEYDVYLLKPNTVYTFKVRAANDCKAGPWSNNMTIKTGANNTKIVNKYYPQSQASIGYLASTFNYIRNTAKNIAKPAEGNKQLAKPTSAPQEKTTTTPTNAPQKSCFLWIFCW